MSIVDISRQGEEEGMHSLFLKKEENFLHNPRFESCDTLTWNYTGRTTRSTFTVILSYYLYLFYIFFLNCSTEHISAIRLE